MAVQLDPNLKDDLKTQFVTREGTYRLMTLSEYSRPNRVGYTNNQSSPQVRVSIVTLPNFPNALVSAVGNNIGTAAGNHHQQHHNAGGGNTNSAAGAGVGINQTVGGISGGGGPSSAAVTASIESRLIGAPSLMLQQTDNGLGGSICGGDRICFNFGKELYIYAYRGVKKISELAKPIDKKLYKGTNPSCHDFNASNATIEGAPLLVGFTTGQIQLIQSARREPGKLYNEERLIDKTKVTCLKWLPGSPNLFLAAHASGHLYLYNEELPCAPTSPNYQTFKMGEGYTILTCKSKSTRNPLYKWQFETENCSINEFSFSPCGSNLAIVSQDGFLRVFHYDTMELLGIARSYFGGFLCVCWSPDGKYICVGGEDDLVTVWSLMERRVVARGEGHRSWVSVVAFDPYTTSYTSWDGGDFSDDENPIGDYRYGRNDSNSHTHECYDDGSNDHARYSSHHRQRPPSAAFQQQQSQQQQDKLATSYRLGSVSQDTQLCLWDITEDVLRNPFPLRHRVNSCNETVSNPQQQQQQKPNGDLVNENVKFFKPIATTNILQAANKQTPNNTGTGSSSIDVIQNSSNSNNSSKNSSNSSSSKFSTANCTTISSSNDSGGVCAVGGTDEIDLNSKNLSNKLNSYTNKQENCVNSLNNSNKIDALAPSNTIEVTESNIKSSKDGIGNKSSEVSSGGGGAGGGLSAFNTLTQRLTIFSFGSDKNKSSDHHHHHNHFSSKQNHHKKTFSLSKSSGSYHSTSLNHSIYGTGHASASASVPAPTVAAISSNDNQGAVGGTNSTQNSLKNSKSSNSSAISSYDPMKLIGTPACPRFDECPILEPLVCKKIAHERLTALIFREDCFLTACQDGFIYTWARPGQNVPQHMSPSPSAPPGGTVV